MGIRILGWVIKDKCYCTFDPGCEVLDQKQYFQIIPPTKKKDAGKNNSEDCNNNHSHSTFKDHHSLGKRNPG